MMALKLTCIATAALFTLSHHPTSASPNTNSVTNNCANEQVASCTDKNPHVDDDEDAHKASTCSLYLARSTLPSSGLGIYTGTPHQVGSIVTPADIAHQILLETDDASTTSQFAEYEILAYEYLWQSQVSGGFGMGKRVESLIPGAGTAANSFAPMVNARSWMGGVDSAGVNVDVMGPGSGAFSVYHDVVYLAVKPMEAGEEIFVDYGDSYFRGRPQQYGMIPLEPEFNAADDMLAALQTALKASPNIQNLFNQGEERNDTLQNELQTLWHTIIHSFVTDERVRNALPSSIHELPRASLHGTAYNYLQGDNPRSLEWLESHGYCMDTLSVRTSNIPNAGRGAFAKRNFWTGETVLPMPLIPMDRRALHIVKDGYVHLHQLILNYCFGHKDSSLLLYPYSSMSNFINHGGERESNAKVVWAEGSGERMGYHNESWLSSTPEDVLGQNHTGLLLLLVATRDINEGEEVLIDYGSEWQQAWDEHTNNWSTNKMQPSAPELNDSESQLRTIFEEPYRIIPSCHYQYVAEHDVSPDDPHGILKEKDDETPDEMIKKLPLIEASARTWQDLSGRTMSGNHLRPCLIFARYENDDDGDSSSTTTTYLVQMLNQNPTITIGKNYDSIPSDEKHYVKGVPRKAILFVDSSRTSNQQNINGFRHEIGLDDDGLWPESWKDRRQ